MTKQQVQEARERAQAAGFSTDALLAIAYKRDIPAMADALERAARIIAGEMDDPWKSYEDWELGRELWLAEWNSTAPKEPK